MRVVVYALRVTGQAKRGNDRTIRSFDCWQKWVSRDGICERENVQENMTRKMKSR